MLAFVACERSQAASPTQAAPALATGQAQAIFAGGCFWCMEGAFEVIEGVDSVESGYTGGPELGPSYQAVSMGQTGHMEAVRVVYRPAKVGFEALLMVFWHNIDPTQSDGQFCDRGDQYRSAIFVGSAPAQVSAEASKAKTAQTLGRPVVTPILPAGTFWLAEAYHQDFYKRNPVRYGRYRAGCGRDSRLKELWGEAAGR